MSNKLAYYRKQAGLTQEGLAEKVGCTRSQIMKLEKGDRRLSDVWLNKFSPILGVTAGAILGDPEPSVKTASQPVILLGTAQAGQFIEVTEPTDDPDYIHLPLQDDVDPRAYHALLVRGDSMNQTDLVDGSTILCLDLYNYPRELKSGLFVVVQRYDGLDTYELTVKELQITPDGNAWLYPRSDNPAHQPIQFDMSTIKDDAHIDHGAQVAIRSVVVGVVPPLGIAGV